MTRILCSIVAAVCTVVALTLWTSDPFLAHINVGLGVLNALLALTPSRP